MSELKQQFKELLKKVRVESRDSYPDIAYKTGIKVEVLKNAGSPSGRSFSVTQRDYDVLKETYFAEKSHSKDEIREDLKEIKDIVQSIYEKGNDIIRPTITALSKETGQSEAELMDLLKEILMEKVIEKKNKKKE